MNNDDALKYKDNQDYGNVELTMYLSKVYGWMFMGLLLTAITAFIISGSQTLIAAIIGNPLNLMLLFIAELALVMILSRNITKLNLSTAVAMFLVYSILNGATFSIILLIYTFSSVTYTFGITAIAFGIMSIYGYITKTDLTKAGKILLMGLIGLIVLSLVNLFVRASSIEWIISIVGLFLFLGLTAYDTQKIKEYFYQAQDNVEMVQKFAVISALKLYLDFINIFLLLIRITGRRR
jgi:uncharacterized protein